MSNNPLIAIVDDDESVRVALTALVRSLGFAAATFASAHEFLASRHLRTVACIITDVNMPGISGPELNRRLIASRAAIPVILITAYPDDRLREQMLGAGVVGYLTKPFDDRDLIACLQSALGLRPPDV